MWRAVNDDGTLTYSFVESLQCNAPISILCVSSVVRSIYQACWQWPITCGKRLKELKLPKNRSRRRLEKGYHMSHEKIETNIGLMAILIVLVISVGGLARDCSIIFPQEYN